MIGELHASFRFERPRLAKVAWERVAKRCRFISVNRWPLDPADLDGEQAVTILCEERERATFERACLLLAGGERFEPDPRVIEAMRGKRARLIAEPGSGAVRRLVRNPGGHWITSDGIDSGPARRPQG